MRAVMLVLLGVLVTGFAIYSALAAPPSSAQGLPFTIGATTGSLLAPGGADVPVNLVFSNPNSSPITVTGVRVTVTGTNTPECSPALANVSVSQQLTGSVASVPSGNVPSSLSDLAVPQSAWPRLHMGDTGTNQDACKGIRVNLSFKGQGTERPRPLRST